MVSVSHVRISCLLQPTQKLAGIDRVEAGPYKPVDNLGDAGFIPVRAAQVRGRGDHMLSARHAIRFRRRYETVTLGDCTPEILFINSKLAPVVADAVTGNFAVSSRPYSSILSRYTIGRF
jgi:hypothetical protein